MANETFVLVVRLAQRRRAQRAHEGAERGVGAAR